MQCTKNAGTKFVLFGTFCLVSISYYKFIIELNSSQITSNIMDNGWFFHLILDEIAFYEGSLISIVLSAITILLAACKSFSIP